MKTRRHQAITAWLHTALSHNTLRAYLADIDRYTHWLHTTTGRDPLTAHPSDLNAYHTHLTNTGYAPATINRNLTSLTAFYRYASDHGHITLNPTVGLTRAPQPRPTPKPSRARRATLTKLFRAAHPNPYDTALLHLLLTPGVFLADLSTARVEDLTTDTHTHLTVRRRCTTHRITLSGFTADALAAHLDGRTTGPLFPTSLGGERSTRSGLAYRLKALSRRAGIRPPVTAKQIRQVYRHGGTV